MKKNRLLLIEDNAEIQIVIQDLFRRDYNVTMASNLAEADQALKSQGADIVLLDVHLPDGDGFSYLSRLKSAPGFEALPVIFLTGQQSSDDKIHGFTLGADDYVTKPFDKQELKMRVAARLRSVASRKENETQMNVGNLHLEIDTQRVYVAKNEKNHALELSPLEFKLLRFFIKNKESVLSRQQLIDTIWGSHIHVLERTIDAHVSRLRKKISSSNCTIRTVYGSGYSFTLVPMQSQAA